MELSQESQDIIKQMEDLATQQKELREQREAKKKDLLQYLYKDLITNLKDHAGKAFLFYINGSYTRIMEYGIAGPHRTQEISFQKIYIGILADSQPVEYYGNSPGYIEDKRLLVVKAYEIILSPIRSQEFEEVESVFLQKVNFHNSESWCFVDLFPDLFPEKRSLWEKFNRTTTNLILGKDKIIEWLGELSTHSVPAELKEKILALPFMK